MEFVVMRNLILMFVAALTGLTLSLPADAAIATTASESRRAAAPTEAELLLAEADFALQMARDGQYGRLSSADMASLREAHARVNAALEGAASLNELSPERRAEVERAREQMAVLLRSDDKDRKICKRVELTGSRVMGMECLTVAQREARARAARSMAGDALRGFCVPDTYNKPGERVSPCVR